MCYSPFKGSGLPNSSEETSSPPPPAETRKNISHLNNISSPRTEGLLILQPERIPFPCPQLFSEESSLGCANKKEKYYMNCYFLQNMFRDWATFCEIFSLFRLNFPSERCGLWKLSVIFWRSSYISQQFAQIFLSVIFLRKFSTKFSIVITLFEEKKLS